MHDTIQLAPGLRGRAESVVTDANTAAAVGSGLLPVYSTPAMCGLMEEAACAAVAECIEEGKGTVGTRLEISHESATPRGMKVWAEALLTAVDGKFLTYEVRAFDEAGLIGKGVHQRCIISVERFMSRCENKAGR